MNHSSCHSHHSHSSNKSGHSLDNSAAASFLRRFWFVTFLLLPLVFLTPAVLSYFNLPDFTARPYLQFAIATIIFGFSLVFFEHARHEIKAKQYGMMTLVSVAVAAGYSFSAVATFLPQLNTEFYLEISTLIWVLLFGHYLEARSSFAAGNALTEVAKLLPHQAHLQLKNGHTKDVPVSKLSVDDIVLVKPGEKVPADGIIISGSANLNESLISGESKPILKQTNDRAVAGSIAEDGSIIIKLDKVGSDSTIKQIEKLILTASQTKPTSQRLADKAAGFLTAISLLTALTTLLVWSLIVGESLTFSITLAITVLVIACPHALGLAIPTVTTIATSLSAKNGIFIKNLAKIEMVKKSNYILFDKTGTLTKGEFSVSQIVPLVEKFSDNDIIRLAASIDSHSSHIIARAIIKKAKSLSLNLKPITDFKNISGQGSIAQINNQTFFIGNHKLAQAVTGLSFSDLQSISKNFTEGSVLFLGSDTKLIGLIILEDEIKPESYQTVNLLHRAGLKVAMLTGDSNSVAAVVAKKLEIDTFFAEVMPKDKYKYVQKLQSEGNIVIMVGDGINDAPALTQADVGVAIGSGTEIAIEAGDIVLTRSNPLDIVRLIKLSRRVYSKMMQNIFWALGYNIIAIPAAAGVFATFGFFIRPDIGAFIMSLSSVIVVANALLLRRLDLSLS